MKRLLDLIHILSKVSRYKVNVQKSVAFLYTNNIQAESQIKNTMPFTMATQKIQYLGILNQGGERSLKKNYKTLLEEITDDTNGNTCHAHELDESILSKCSARCGG